MFAFVIHKDLDLRPFHINPLTATKLQDVSGKMLRNVDIKVSVHARQAPQPGVPTAGVTGLCVVQGLGMLWVFCWGKQELSKASHCPSSEGPGSLAVKRILPQQFFLYKWLHSHAILLATYQQEHLRHP